MGFWSSLIPVRRELAHVKTLLNDSKERERNTFDQLVRHREHTQFMSDGYNAYILELQHQNKSNQRKSRYIKKLRAENKRLREMLDKYLENNRGEE